VAVQVRWSPRAAADLERICDHIGQDSQVYAALFARRVVALVEGLAEFPRSGRVVPEYGIETLREKIFQSYRIVYRVRGDAVEVAAIVHGARVLPDAL
jgi:plasmid stabilization system protein ParE